MEVLECSVHFDTEGTGEAQADFFVRVSEHAFREVPSGFRRDTVPGATVVFSLTPDTPRMPKNKSKKAHLVPAPKARQYYKVLAVKFFPGCAEGQRQGQRQGQPLSPQKLLKTCLVPVEGTFE